GGNAADRNARRGGADWKVSGGSAHPNRAARFATKQKEPGPDGSLARDSPGKTGGNGPCMNSNEAWLIPILSGLRRDEPSVLAPHGARLLELGDEPFGQLGRRQPEEARVEVAVDAHALHVRRTAGEREAALIGERNAEDHLERMSRDAQRVGFERCGARECSRQRGVDIGKRLAVTGNDHARVERGK